MKLKILPLTFVLINFCQSLILQTESNAFDKSMKAQNIFSYK